MVKRESSKQVLLLSEELNLADLVMVLWARKITILVTTVLGVLIAIAAALLLPKMYESKAVLAPSQGGAGGGLSALAQQYGGLASLAGIDLSAGAVDNSAINIEILKSRRFLTSFIRRHELEVPLMAGIAWDKTNDQLLIDDSVYDESNASWLPPDWQNGPTEQELFEEIDERLVVQQDKSSGLLNVSIRAHSPSVAKDWLEALIADINEEIRDRDVTKARNAIAYLEEQAVSSPLESMRTVFYGLIEEQTKTVMLASISPDYSFEIVDPPFYVQRPVSPRRVILLFLGVILGALSGLFIALLRSVRFDTSN